MHQLVIHQNVLAAIFLELAPIAHATGQNHKLIKIQSDAVEKRLTDIGLTPFEIDKSLGYLELMEYLIMRPTAADSIYEIQMTRKGVLAVNAETFRAQWHKEKRENRKMALELRSIRGQIKINRWFWAILFFTLISAIGTFGTFILEAKKQGQTTLIKTQEKQITLLKRERDSLKNVVAVPLNLKDTSHTKDTIKKRLKK